MKWLAVFAVLALSPAFSPVPRPTIQDANSAKRGEASHGKANKYPPTAIASTHDSGESLVSQNAKANKQSQSPEQPVAVGPIRVDKDRFDYAYIIATIAIALTTLIVGSYAVGQARTAKRAAQFAEMALKLSERADVLLSAAGIKLPMTQQFTGGANGVMSFKNYGRTRANNLVFAVSATVPKTPTGAPERIGPVVLAAGEDYTISFQPFKEWMSQETFTGIMAGAVILRFDGEITYDDVFGQSHITECAGRYDVSSQAFRFEKNRGD